MSTIQAQRKTVRQLLDNTKYRIDFYQREYEWGRRNIEELLEDFEGKFLSAHDPDHERSEVRSYPRYFLGTIITVTESGQKHIVDGQQRLTTLTLLLLHIQHLGDGREGIADLKTLIFSESYGTKSFNIYVPERVDCMQELLDNGCFDASGHRDLSVRNLVSRYEDLQESFPDSLSGNSLPFFVDWLIDNVDLVEIEAYTDDDAFTIFETMNDRGVSLGPVDMLKGYLLANINSGDENTIHEKKTEANKVWKQRIVQLIDIAPKEDQNFFKIWLRAKYAQSTRERHKGAVNRDFENINRFHRWVRDEKQRLGLNTSQSFYEFVTKHFDRYAGHYLNMYSASTTLTKGSEEIYYNACNNFTLQFMLAMAPIQLDDDNDTVAEKIRIVTTFIDIYSARRILNFKWISYNTVQYAVFNLMKAIRNLDVIELRAHLREYLDRMDEKLDAASSFYLHGRNSGLVNYLLSRITAYVEQQSGMNTNFVTYTRGNGARFELEHIWADNYENHTDEFDSEDEFHRLRNYFGGLVLLPRGTNQSFGAAPYEDKVNHYVKENLLAASLNHKAYEKNPNFSNFLARSSLQFKPHAQFKRDDLMERQELYRQICEQIWNPDRLLAGN